MALITTDRVKENASVVGFGDAVLIGSPAGFQTFSSVMDIGDTCYYSIVDTTTGYWETGIGTLTSVNLLQRTTVKTSSFDDDKVSFTDGDKTISLALTSDQFLNLVAATLTQSDITSLVDARYVQFDNDIAQSVTGSGTFGVASSSGIYEASVVLDNALGVESSYSDDAYISTFNLRSNQSSWTVQDLVSSQNINVVLTSTSIDLFYNGNYSQTGNSLLTRSMMDARYQAVGDYLNTTWNGNVITGQYGGTGVANTGKTITIGGNLTTSGAFETTLTATANTSVTLPTTGTLATLAGTESLSNKYITTSAGNTTVAGLILTSGTNTTAVANGSIEFDNVNYYFSLAGTRKTVAYLDSNLTGTWSGTVVAGQYGGTGIANTGKTITIGGNLTTSGAFTTTLTSTANTSVTLPTSGTLATLAGPETFTNKTLSTNTTWNGNVITGQYGGTGVANTGKTITIGGNLTTSGSFDTSITITAGTSITLPTAGTLATLAGSETLTNKTLSTNTTWNGNVITGQYGGTGVANTGKTITIGGNLTTSGAFTTTLTSTANTSVTLPITGTLATLAGTESFSNKYITTGAGNTTVAGLILTSGTNTTAVANGSIEFDNVNYYFSVAGARKVNAYLDSNLTGTWSGTVVAGQYGGTGIANTGKTITIGGNLTTSGAFTTTLTSTANTSITLPTTGTLATLAGTESLSNKYITTGAGNTTVAGLILTSGTNTTAVANGSIEFDNTNYYFSVAGARKVNAYLDSNLTGTWSGTAVAGQYGGTGIANTGKTITIGGNLTTSGAFTTTLTSTANTSVTLPTTGTLATLAGSETLTNKILSTNVDYNGNVVLGQYGGTGIANTGKTITIGGNFTTSGAFATTLTATANTSVTLPTTGTLSTLAGIESFTNKTMSTNTTWNGNVIPGQYGGTGIANTGFTLTMAGNVSHAGAFTQTLTATADTSVTLPVTGTLATLAGIETLTNKTLSTNTTWNGNIIAGDYGGTGVANTGKTITIGGNLTTSGAFTTTLASTANTSVTLPTTGTLSTLAGSETFTNKTLSTNTTWNGNIVTGQYGGTGVANTGKTITIGGNLTTSGAFTTTLTATANTSVTLPTTGTLATLSDVDSLNTGSTAGVAWLWGSGADGRLGDNTVTNRSSPVQTIAGGTNWKQASCRAGHSAAIKTDGTLWLWGSGGYGQLGDGTTTNRSSPVQTITTGANWKNVSCGETHTAATKTDGTLWTWGRNNNGQLGDNTTAHRSSPVQTIAGGTNWKQVSCGYRHTACVKTDGTLWLWGNNSNSVTPIGDNTDISRSSPVQTITGGTNWSQVSCGRDFTAAIKTDGTLWTWGNNYQGQLGNGFKSSQPKSSPIQTITGGNTWTEISCGFYHTAAIKTDGTLWLWGQNTSGTLGDGTTTEKLSPVQTITGGNTWTEISCGDGSSAAIKTDGSLWLWGANSDGRLGDNTVSNRSSPIQTVTGGYRWLSVSIGGLTFAIASDIISGDKGGTGAANTGKTITIGGNLTTSGAFTTTLTSTANTSVTLPTAGTLATLAGSETLTNKILSTNVDYNGNVVLGQYGGTGIANTGKTITIGGNFTTSGAFTTTLTSTANTSVTLPTTGTLATLAGTETLSSKVVSLAAGNATTAPLKFVSGTNMTAAAAGNMEFDGTRLYFSPSTTRQTVAFLTDITGANTFSGSQNLQDNELIRAKIRDYSETVSSPTISSGTLTLNLETSNIFTVSLNAAITTLTISNPPANGSGGSFTLIFIADGTARAVTWPASIKWMGGFAPSITSTNGKEDSFSFFTRDGGTYWQGYVGGQNF